MKENQDAIFLLVLQISFRRYAYILSHNNIFEPANITILSDIKVYFSNFILLLLKNLSLLSSSDNSTNDDEDVLKLYVTTSLHHISQT